MKKPFYFFLTSVTSLISGCNYQNNFEHSFLLNSNKRIKVEFYKAGIIGNLTSLYVTDSSNFRLYLGTYDPENEFIHVKTSQDSIITEKIKSTRRHTEHKNIISRKSYSISQLVKNQEFD